MDGIGEKLIEALLDNGLVESIFDLYRLNHSQISNLERMGDKSAYNVLDELAGKEPLILQNSSRLRNRKDRSGSSNNNFSAFHVN